MSYEFVTYERRPADHVAIVTMNRPSSMNALHNPASQEMAEIWDDFAADPELWVAVLTGAGNRAFSAGMDLKWRQGPSDPERPPSGWGGLLTRFDLTKPIIAAVNGWAMGGGLEIALACDVIIAAEHAQLGLPEVRVGTIGSESGGIHRLPRQIPQKIALGMMLTGRPIGAQEAHRIGLVNEVVPADQLLTTALRWAGWIVEAAPLAVRGAKEASLIGLDLPLEAAILRRYSGVERNHDSTDQEEGRHAFAEKRPPRWSGQ